MSIFAKVKQKLIKYYFRKKSAGVVNTPVLSNIDTNSNIVLLSMVQTSDVYMLMLAVKSFVRYVPVKRIVIVADPSLTQSDKALLKEHFIAVDFIDAVSVRDSAFPSGGCWERILGIASISDNDYVIQLDADTITVAEPEQVKEIAAAGKSFTLGTWDGLEIVSTKTASEFAKARLNPKGSHIQMECEAILDQLPEGFNRYVRGCAGFAGYRKGSLTKERLAVISQFYYEKLGSRWEEWGSEQFASNLAVANDEGSCVLNIEKYGVPDNGRNTLVFHHYIGTMRYANLIYVKNAEALINDLKSV